MWHGLSIDELTDNYRCAPSEIYTVMKNICNAVEVKPKSADEAFKTYQGVHLSEKPTDLGIHTYQRTRNIGRKGDRCSGHPQRRFGNRSKPKCRNGNSVPSSAAKRKANWSDHASIPALIKVLREWNDASGESTEEAGITTAEVVQELLRLLRQTRMFLSIGQEIISVKQMNPLNLSQQHRRAPIQSGASCGRVLSLKSA